MAEIHLARRPEDVGFDKVVVVKRLLPELTASREYIAMLFDEGTIAGRLDHPNVCEVFEMGRDGAESFLVMPYLEGVPVQDLIARPREADRIAELKLWAGIVVQVCAGLHYAHELRDDGGRSFELVHRDISPSNLFVTVAGLVKVLDFGIAKTLGSNATEAGTLKGKTQYMSPEHLMGKKLDRRSDLFALGIVMFELATHQRLFKRDSDYLTAKAILEEPIPRVDAVDPAIPAAIADVIAGALAREPAKRPADAQQLAQQIVAAMAAHGGVASPSEIASVVTSTEELTAQRTRRIKVLDDARSRGGVTRSLQGERTTIDPRRPNWLEGWTKMVMIGFAATIALALGIVMIWRAVGPDNGPASTLSDAAVGTVGAGGAVDANSAIDAGTVAVVTDAAPVDALVPVRDAAPAVTEPARAKPGTFSIDSTPFATIFVDGKRLDVTPILRRPLPAGRHRIRAVLADGRTKELAIEVRAGKAAKPIMLTW